MVRGMARPAALPKIDLGPDSDKWAFITWLAYFFDSGGKLDYEYVKGYDPQLPSIADADFGDVIAAFV